MSTWTDFSEIDPSVLMPGETLRASTLAQINENAKQAVLTPEFFGPVNYSDSDTVALPTSTVDGYVYSRDELFYIWEWREQNANSTGSHFRIPGFYATIDQATGVVTLKVWRLKSGGPYVTEPDGGNATISIRVLTVALRKITAASTSTASPNEPTDVNSIIADDDGIDDTVEGS